MDIISELKWILVKRENQKSIIVSREFQDYPPGSVITTDKGTLGEFRSIFGPFSAQFRFFIKLAWVYFGHIWVGFGLIEVLGQVVSNSNMQSVFGLFNSMIHVDFYQFLNRNNIKARLILNFKSVSGIHGR